METERRVCPIHIHKNMKNESQKTLTENSFPPYNLNFTSSVIEPKESPDEISDKICKMIPDIGVIRKTEIIKNTESFKESKHIIDSFRENLSKISEGTFEHCKITPPHEEIDGEKSALERAVNGLQFVVNNMLRAGIEVPSIFKDFLYATRPTQTPKELEIINQPPLFKITGLDENGEVVLKTDTPIVLKKGDTKISLTHEKLKGNVEKSQKVDCKSAREFHEWLKQNLYKVGTMEKIDSDEWEKFLLSIVDVYKPKPKEEPSVKIEVPKSTNLNAYEIRLQVLQESLNWVKNNNSNNTEDVLEVANKFYKFIENKK